MILEFALGLVAGWLYRPGAGPVVRLLRDCVRGLTALGGALWLAWLLGATIPAPGLLIVLCLLSALIVLGGEYETGRLWPVYLIGGLALVLLAATLTRMM